MSPRSAWEGPASIRSPFPSGTVNITLNVVSGADDPTVQVGLGLGSPSGFGCNATNTITTAAGSTPQLTGAYEAGVYCTRIYDVGNLTAPATLDVTIAHP